jgi:hypothetical protein
VRWYLRYAISYRDLEEMMEERGLAIDHTTIYRWVQRYAPELEKRCRLHLRSTNDSYRVDETYEKSKGNDLTSTVRSIPLLQHNRFAPPRICGRWQRRRPIVYNEARQRPEKRKDFLGAKNLPENDFQKSSKAADFQQD